MNSAAHKCRRATRLFLSGVQTIISDSCAIVEYLSYVQHARFNGVTKRKQREAPLSSHSRHRQTPQDGNSPIVKNDKINFVFIYCAVSRLSM